MPHQKVTARLLSGALAAAAILLTGCRDSNKAASGMIGRKNWKSPMNAVAKRNVVIGTQIINS